MGILAMGEMIRIIIILINIGKAFINYKRMKEDVMLGLAEN